MPYEIKQKISDTYQKRRDMKCQKYEVGRAAGGVYDTLSEAREALVAEIRDSCGGECDFDPWTEDPPVVHEDTGMVQFHVAKIMASKARVGQVITVNDFHHKIVRVKSCES